MVIFHQSVTCQFSSESLKPYDSAILEREQFPIKNLYVEFRNDCDACKDCPAVEFVQQMLKNFGDVLEEFSLDSDLEDVIPLRHVALHFSFPNLETLKLQSEIGILMSIFQVLSRTL